MFSSSALYCLMQMSVIITDSSNMLNIVELGCKERYLTPIELTATCDSAPSFSPKKARPAR